MEPSLINTGAYNVAAIIDSDVSITNGTPGPLPTDSSGSHSHTLPTGRKVFDSKNGSTQK